MSYTPLNRDVRGPNLQRMHFKQLEADVTHPFTVRGVTSKTNFFRKSWPREDIPFSQQFYLGIGKNI